jgi:hypothetical protein
MAEKRLVRWELIGLLWTAAAGTLLHFAYGWSGGNRLAAAFASVNESTFEHMKLFFVPVFLFTLAEYFFIGRERTNFLAVRGLSAWAGTLLIPVLYYTYTGVLGRSIPWVNIAVFFLAAAATFLLDAALLRRGKLSAPGWQLLGLLLLLGGLFLMIFYTFRPLPLPLWRDPVTGKYGI